VKQFSHIILVSVMLCSITELTMIAESNTMKKPHLLLINPWIHDFKAFDLWMKPMGLLYLAAILVQEGYEISYIDCLKREVTGKIVTKQESYGCGKYPCQEIEKPAFYSTIPRKYKRYGMTIEHFHQSLRSIPEPQAVLVTSSMSYWYGGPFEAIRMVKEFFPQVPILLGGIYCRLAPQHAREHSAADHVISSGDMDEILDSLASITGNPGNKSCHTFAAYPPPAWHLISGSHYLPLLTSLGCPCRCSYCATPILYSGHFRKEGNALFEEVSHAVAEGSIRDIAFYDDALIVNFEQYLEIFLTMVMNSGLALRFHTPNALHARLIDRRRAEIMKQSGFCTIRLGFEMSNPEQQISTGGKVTSGELERALYNLFQAGFKEQEVGVYVMTGVPGIPACEVKEALQFVFSCGAMTTITAYSPLPGTGLWNNFPGSDTFEATDPLFHNNTYHTYRGTVLPYQEYLELKQLSRDLNRRLREGS
jgi:hypothetical protein